MYVTSATVTTLPPELKCMPYWLAILNECTQFWDHDVKAAVKTLVVIHDVLVQQLNWADCSRSI